MTTSSGGELDSARRRRRPPVPEHGERAVVSGDVLGPVAPASPAPPSRRPHASASPTQPSACANVERRADRHLEPGTPQHTRERDRDALRAGSAATRRSGTARHRRADELGEAVRAHASWSSRYFRIVPSVASTAASSSRVAAERRERLRPSRSSPRRRAACTARARAAPPTAAATSRASSSGTSRRAQPHDRELALEVGMRDPVVEAPPLQRVVHVARAVRREHHDRRHLGAHDAELGHRDRPVGEDLEQERLELVVGPVDLVDQQHRRDRAVVRERAQQRTLDEEPLGVELVLVDLRSWLASTARRCRSWRE